MDQLLVALDVDSTSRAIALADDLRGIAGGFKIGSRLFTSEGPPLVRHLVERGDRVFLDLKFHDIPCTVASAVRAAARLGVWMIDVHASGGSAMMRAAKEAAGEGAAAAGGTPPLVIAVTVLTSISELRFQELGIGRSVLDHVESLATLAQQAGLDGVVASAQEAPRVRARCGNRFVIVTPGIRDRSEAAGSPGTLDDQARTVTAAEALRSGASYIVVGRPIIAAASPRAAAERLARSTR